MCGGVQAQVHGERVSDLTRDSTQAQALAAPDDDLASVPIEELPEVTVTATRSTEEPVFRVPTAVTVLGKRRVNEQPTTTILDLLKGEVGVWVQSSGPGQGTPYVRGVTGREVLLLQDGFRVSPAFMRSGPNQYLALLDPFSFERLEILRGPASVLYGSDALGGAVNVVTPNVAAFTREGVETQGRVVAGFSSASTEKSGRLEVAAGSAGRAIRLGLTYRDFDDFRLGGSPNPRLVFPNTDTKTASGTGYDYRSIDLNLSFDLDRTQRLILSGLYTEIPRFAAIDSLVQGYGTAVIDQANFFTPQARAFGTLTYEVTPEASWLTKGRFTVGYQYFQDDRLRRPYVNTAAGDFRPRFPNYGTGIAQNYQDRERNNSNLFGALLTLTSELGRHTLTYGGEVYTDTVFSNTERLFDAGNVVNQNSRYISGSRLSQYGAYVQDVIRWTDELTTILGVRYSSVTADVPGDSRRASAAFSNTSSDLTYNVGISYLLVPEVNFVVNVARGFRAPNLSDLSQSGVEGNLFNSPNPGLRAEQVFSVDTGFKFRSSSVSGELIGFYSQYSDRILPVNTGQLVAGLPERRLENVSSQIVGGVEFGSQYRLDPNLTLFGTATWTQGDTTLVGGSVVPADRIPPFNGVFGVRWEPSENLYFQPFLRYAGAQYRLAPNNLTDNRINPNGTPGFFVLNFRAGLRLSENLWLRLAGENLTDNNYREHGSSLDGLGANVFANLDYRY